METFNEFLQAWAVSFLIVMGVSFGLFLLCIGFAMRQMKKLDLPADATLNETLQKVPFIVVLTFDLLDLSLDIFAAPIAWAILSRYNLTALRNTAALEAIIPGTQAIPTLTIMWIVMRLFPGRFR